MESVGVDEAALSLLAEAGDGSMRDALSIMDQAIASAPLVNGAHTLEASQIRSLMGTVSNQVFENMMEAVKEQNAASMLRAGRTIARRRQQPAANRAANGALSTQLSDGPDRRNEF